MIKQLHLVLLSVLMLAFSNASAQDVITFDFSTETSYEQFGLAGNSNQDGSNAGDILNNVTATQGATTLTVSPSTNEKTPNRMWQSGKYFNLRIYGGNITIASDKNIAKIEFDNFKTGNITSNTGSVADKVWTAGESTKSVEFTFTKGKDNTFINKIKITFGDGSGVDPDPTPDPTENVAENIADFNALCTNDGADVTLKLTDAKVLYVNEYESKGKQKQEIFVRDATGSVMFYNAGLTVKNGDVLNGSIKGSAKDFYGTAEFCNNGETDITALTITDGALAVGETRALNEISDKDISNLVAVNDVKMTAKEETDDKGKTHTNYYMVDAAGNEFAFYNTFHTPGFDAQDFVDKTGLNFIGIIKLHFGTKQLCPVDPVNTGIDCIENVELNVNAPMYNMEGQKVDASFKGIVLQNGKKFINK